MKLELLASESLRVFALCSGVLVLKLMSLSIYEAVVRWRQRAFVNPEDARLFGVEAVDREHPEVRRVQRARRDDVEMLGLFFVVGLLYVLGGASVLGAQAYLITFTVARVFYTWCYLAGVQPWRTVNFVIGLLCLAGMLTRIILSVFS